MGKNDRETRQIHYSLFEGLPSKSSEKLSMVSSSRCFGFSKGIVFWCPCTPEPKQSLLFSWPLNFLGSIPQILFFRTTQFRAVPSILMLSGLHFCLSVKSLLFKMQFYDFYPGIYTTVGTLRVQRLERCGFRCCIPENILSDRSYLLFEALEQPSCQIRLAELFPGSRDSNLRNHPFYSHAFRAGHSFATDLLPVEPPLLFVCFLGLLLSVTLLDGLPLPLVDPYVLPLFECSLKFTLGSLLASLERAPLFLDPLLFPRRPSNLFIKD